MKQKIVITGGLGYIGTELCKLYSGETRFKNIVVTDNRFISERVSQLQAWGFDFKQISILDKEGIADIVKDADIIHHLAGITDVAYVKTQLNSEQDLKITDTAITGTNNILNAIPSHCKIIFPSTHVVFEGFSEAKYQIQENETPCPILTYATSKAQNELDITSSGKNYVILRLGSVYGYSTDSMRIGIMPNLFSKMSSQHQNIKLFSKGVQYKSLVNLIDTARCFKFMAEQEIKNEIFHLVNEQATVREVAELCKKYQPVIKLEETEDEIPNQGYTLSNKKLLETGFKFLYNLEGSIKEMIQNWSLQKARPELEYTVQGTKNYVDERGKISNYELTEPVNLIGYIESKAGTVRANHYHPIQEQKCLLIKGKYISVIKDLSDSKAQIHTQLIQEGDLAIIKPNVAHTMVFLEDSIFLNLVHGEREHQNYGITHTIPYILVDGTFKEKLLNDYATFDRVDNKGQLRPVLSLGLSPLANNLIGTNEENVEMYPLELTYCPESHNCQLSYNVPPKKMFDHYLYVSSTTKSFREHFIAAAEKYISKFNLTSSSLVVDIGSNDGIALVPLKEKGIRVLGIEPAKNIVEIALEKGIPTVCEYFNREVAKNVKSKYGLADVVTASNVFAHTTEIDEIALGVFELLKQDGTFIVEVQYLLNTIEDLTFDNIYHEHVNYWSVTSLNNFFNKLGLVLKDIEYINTHGGSLRAYVQRTGSPEDSILHALEREKQAGLTNYNTYLSFAGKVQQARDKVQENITKIKSQGLSIVGYGAPAKATTLLNYFNITSQEIDYIVEDNNLKHGKYIPGVNVPIYSKDKLTENPPDIILVLAWNFFEEIKRSNQDLLKKGIQFINIKDLQK